MQVVLAEPAEREFLSIIDYIAQDKPPAPRKEGVTIGPSADVERCVVRF